MGVVEVDRNDADFDNSAAGNSLSITFSIGAATNRTGHHKCDVCCEGFRGNPTRVDPMSTRVGIFVKSVCADKVFPQMRLQTWIGTSMISLRIGRRGSQDKNGGAANLRAPTRAPLSESPFPL